MLLVWLADFGKAECMKQKQVVPETAVNSFCYMQ